MNRVAEITAQINVNDGVSICFSDTLEVSLDCSDCQRKLRTVIFSPENELGICTPTGHKFRGKQVSKSTWQTENCYSVKYNVAYEYEPFIDCKYPDDPHYYGASQGVPTWGRVHFSINCPKCKNILTWTTQNNLVRPWTKECTCMYALFTEIEEMPKLTWHDQ